MGNLISQFATWLWNAWQQFFGWVMCRGYELSDPVAGQLAALLPEEQLIDLSTITEWMAYAETWVPVSFGLTMAVLYLGIAGTVWVVRVVIALIPTIG